MALATGNIAFVGFNADGNDNIAFVALVDIGIGEQIIFEDNEWNGTAFADTNEGAFSWTASSVVPAGTIVRIDNIGGGTIAASTGTAATPVTGRGTNRGISAGDETIYAYQGTAVAPTFITAIANGGFSAANGLLTNTGLTVGVNAIDLSTVDDDADIAAYNGTRSGQASFSSYLTLINNPANWLTQDATGDQSIDGTPPDVPFSSTVFQISGGNPTVNLSVSSNSGSEASASIITVIATASSAVTGDQTVSLGVTGTGITGGDYTLSDTTITIPNGTTTGSVTFTIVNDGIAEGAETAILAISSPSSGITLGGTLTQNIAIADSSSGADLISSIQGSGATSPVVGSTKTIEAIVVGDFQGASGLNGFYVQEEDADADANPLTSEGIFVFSNTAVSIGDKVSITGTIAEGFGQTQITPTSLTVVNGGNTLPTAATVNLPLPTSTFLEQYEGMRVSFPQSLTVTEHFQLARFGEIVLSSGGRLTTPTNTIDPNDNPASGTSSSGTSNVAAVTAAQTANNLNKILIDDGSGTQNVNPVPYIDPITKTLRIGSTTTGITGVLGFGFSNYRLQPTAAPTFNYAPRPLTPPNINSTGTANLKVASFNVLNYFTTIDNGSNNARGADSLAEFVRQKDKIISAITQLNADVVGLIEIENNGATAISDLVSGLNTVAGSGTYAAISDPSGINGNPGTDAIKVAFIYKPSAVTPVGTAISFNDPAFNLARPPLAQTFSVNANGAIFTPIINHFKSKGSSAGLPGDADQGDGQGLSNQSRKNQATALLNFVAQVQTASGDSDVLVMGDLNAYGEEDPIDILRAGGLTKLATATDSYVFDGQTGSLDHALVNASLLSQITGAAKWNINSDEPNALEYNDNIVTPGTGDFPINDTTLYQVNPFRSSDHDPVVIGLNLGSTLVSVTAIDPTATEAGAETGTFRITRTGSTVSALTVNYSVSGSATNGTDYTPNLASSIVIPVNSSFVDITVKPVDDILVEGSELITIAITDAALYDLGANSVSTVTIADNDIAIPTPTPTPGTTIIGSLYLGNNLNNVIVAGVSNDTIYSYAGDDLVLGGDGADYIDGGIGNDTLLGLNGNDTLLGGTGNDSLLSGFGADTLIGGAADDVFVYNTTNDGGDTIADFAAATEKIRISAFGFGGGLIAGSTPILTLGSASIGNYAQFLYNGGVLSFDVDGTGLANGAVVLATLSSAPALSASNLVVF